MTSTIDLGHPRSGDIVDVILDDHRRMEHLLRRLRDRTSDRVALRDAMATVLIAHAEAEEVAVYPTLRHRAAVSAHDAEHGREEHAEGHDALLALMELKGTDTQAFDDALEELSNAICHHLIEEELTILNPARDDLGERARAELGRAFSEERQRQIDAGCGTLTNLRKIVARAEREGLLDDEDDDEG